MSAVAESSPQRDWWLRALLVLQAPTAVFTALRNQDEDDVDARAEPLLAIALLAGVAAVLSSPQAGRYLDDADAGLLVVAAWAIFAGVLYGGAIVWLGGLLVHLAARRLGSQGTYRRARHVLGLALAPVALSLLLLWPLRLSLYGNDVFRSGGADHGAAGAQVLDAFWAGSAAWALALVLVGIRAVHGWGWPRAAAALALACALPALVVLAHALA